jgi:hypothetical protein
VFALFAEPALQLGRTRWGLKEVRYGSEAIEVMRQIFPGTLVIHVTRDPRDVLRSLDWWEREGKITREGTREALANWHKVNAELLALRSAPWMLSVRYEDMVAAPRDLTLRLAGLLGIDADQLDLEVFDQRIHGDGPQGRLPRTLTPFAKLDERLRSLLCEPQLIATAASYGYDLDERPARSVASRVRLASRRFAHVAHQGATWPGPRTQR